MSRQQDLDGGEVIDTDRPRVQRKSDRVHFSINAATLVTLLTGGGGYLYQDMKASAEAKARAVVLEDRLIQLQNNLGEANAKLVGCSRP